MESVVAETQFQRQRCERCGRQTLHALQASFGVCAGCEPDAFERLAHQAGRREFLR